MAYKQIQILNNKQIFIHSIFTFYHFSPVHGGEPWPNRQDRVGPGSGAASGTGTSHQDLDGQDHLPDRGFTAAEPR